MKRSRDDDELVESEANDPAIFSCEEHPEKVDQISKAASSLPELTENDAHSFLNSVKDASKEERNNKYVDFLKLMRDFMDKKMDIPGVILKVRRLFLNNHNLIQGFNVFLQREYKIRLPPEEESFPEKEIKFEDTMGFVKKIKARLDENVYRDFVAILYLYRNNSKPITEVYQEVSILFQDDALLVEFINILPDVTGTVSPNHVKSLENHILKGDSSVSPMALEWSTTVEKWSSSERDEAEREDGEKGLEVDDKIVPKRKSDRSCRESLQNNTQAFNDNIDRETNKDNDNKESERHNRGLSSNARKVKSLAKSIHDLDLSNCESCTPSYRKLPENYPIPSTRWRTNIGNEVLNDHWVSTTSGSEDFSVKHMRKNQYEERLFRCEDDRFEYDMLLESMKATANRVEELLDRIESHAINTGSSFCIEDHLTALNLRCIERLYDDHGLDVLDMLRKNAPLALPVILTRLKQKQGEWERCRDGLNEVWAKVYAKNHHKSLDYSKQRGTKNSTAKDVRAGGETPATHEAEEPLPSVIPVKLNSP